MTKIERVDVSRFVLDIHSDRSISTRIRKPGPPERIDRMTVGIRMVTEDAPHEREMHPDGDEILARLSPPVSVGPTFAGIAGGRAALRGLQDRRCDGQTPAQKLVAEFDAMPRPKKPPGR